MTILKKSLLLLVLLLAFYFNGYTQEIIINGDKTERLLTWDDFKGRADKSTGYYAETHWELSFGKIGFRSDQEIPLKDLVLTLKFNEKKSWVVRGKETPELLKHEQGHFDIGRLCQLEMLATIKKTNFTKENFISSIQKIFDTTLNKYLKIGIQYDAESKHSINKEKQEEWNLFLADEKKRLLKLNE